MELIEDQANLTPYDLFPEFFKAPSIEYRFQLRLEFDEAYLDAAKKIAEALDLNYRQTSTRKALYLVLVNLMRMPGKRLYLPMSQATYENCSRNPAGISYSGIKRVTRELKERELIDYEPGKQFEFKETVIVPKGELLKLVSDHALLLESSRCVILPSVCIELREENTKRCMRYEPSEQTTALETQIQALRDHSKQFRLSLSPKAVGSYLSHAQAEKELEKLLTFEPPEFFRVFKGSLQLYGRIHVRGGKSYQQLAKIHRGELLIDSKYAVCLDYRGSFVNLIYLETTGKKYQVDPYSGIYDLERCMVFPRDLVKLAMNTMFNCRDLRSAMSATLHASKDKPEFFDIDNLPPDISKRMIISRMMKAILEHHKSIKHKFFADNGKQGLQLMYLESELAIAICMKAIAAGIPLYPLHDGFITSWDHQWQVGDWMEEAIKDRYGDTCLVGEKIYKVELT